MVREHSKRSASSKAELCKRFASHFQAEHPRDYAGGSYLCGCLPIETWIDTKHKGTSPFDADSGHQTRGDQHHTTRQVPDAGGEQKDERRMKAQRATSNANSPTRDPPSRCRWSGIGQDECGAEGRNAASHGANCCRGFAKRKPL